MQGHLRKRGDRKWQAVIYLGRDELGKKKYKYQTVNGTKKDAQRVLTELLHSINNNTFVNSEAISYEEYLERWLQDYCFHKLAPKTYQKYESIVKNHIVPELGKTELAKLQALQIQKYYGQKLIKGRQGLRNKHLKGLHPATVLYHHRIIHSSLERALKWGLIGRNVADVVDPPRAQKSEVNIVSQDKLRQVLDIAREKYPALYMPVVIAATTGMRRGEILGLQWKDINIAQGQIHIKQQLQKIEKEFVLRATKTDGSRRSIKIPVYLIRKLEGQKEWQQENKKVFKEEGKQYAKNNYVCTMKDGSPVNPDYITKTFIKVAKKLEIDNSFHDLRHTFATSLLKSGIHVKVVSEMLGHSSVKITLDTYSHLLPEHQEAVVSVIDEQFRSFDEGGEVSEVEAQI